MKYGGFQIGKVKKRAEGGEGRRNALDFGLQALLFLGRALDGARVLCVRLGVVYPDESGEGGSKLKGKRSRTAVTDS